MLSLSWTQVQSLVGELRLHKPCGADKKQTKPPDGWINKVWLIHTREYDSTFIKKEGTVSHSMAGRKLEDIMLSDISESVSRSVVSDSLRPHGAHQALLCMDFSCQRYWSGLPFPSPGT